MTHTPLIATIVGGIGLAFVLGTFAHRLRLSPLIGYLAAGVLIGPHTPGFVGDQDLARQLAEVGVILLMFGTGLARHCAVDQGDVLIARWRLAMVTLLAGRGCGLRGLCCGRKLKPQQS
jgi:predicted Kef-type K+ transport protein